MKGRRILIAALMTVAVFSVAGVAMAGPWLGKGGFAGFGGFAGLGKSVKEGTVFTPPAETLGLTDEQIAQIQEIQSSATAKNLDYGVAEKPVCSAG